MIVYNVTTQMHIETEDEWIKFMRTDHIPKILATGCFIDHKLFKLVEIQGEAADDFMITYIAQYLATDISAYHNYISSFSNALRNDVIGKFGDTVTSFRTVLQSV